MPDQYGWPTVEEWREGLPPTQREQFHVLAGLLSEAGAREPESWARSEISENIAQAARYSFLRAIWRELERWRDPQFVDRFLADRDLSDPDDARRLLAEVAFQATLDAVMVVDHGEDIDGVNGMPGWLLIETDDEGRQTGRDVGGLHESFLEVDPKGIEAEDIRGW